MIAIACLAIVFIWNRRLESADSSSLNLTELSSMKLWKWWGATLAALALVAQLVLPGGASASERSCPSDPPAAGRVEQVDVPSPALGTSSRVCVLLPHGYDDGSTRYPVLYLLHGVGDDQSSWLQSTDVEEAVADLPLIVVMPEAGHTPDAGWYSDWACATAPCTPDVTPAGPRWETYHVRELVPFVDARYRTVAQRSGRAIAGFSMGGFGALTYAARHPELFGAAASISGIVDIANGGPGEAALFQYGRQNLGTPDERVWGDYAGHEVRWRDHNPPDIVGNLRWTKLFVVTGSGVPAPGDSPVEAPVEAAILPTNVSLRAAMARHGIEVDYTITPTGTHSWRYRQEALHVLLPKLLDALTAPMPPTPAFDYRSAEPEFDAWGWAFATDPARAREFIELADVSRDGMHVRGSGALTVLTPALFVGGSAHTVRVSRTNLAGITTVALQSVPADGLGRLQFTVGLGPPHTTQQYTPAARALEASPDYWSQVTVQIV